MARRTSAQREKDLAYTAKKYCEGVIQAEIADELGVTQATISNDLNELRSRWLASSIRDFDAARAEELAKVDNLEREYWEAWKRSCEDAETVTEKIVGDTKNKRGEKTRRVEGQAGDPRFLAGVQWCIERRCKILGIDAPTRQDITSYVSIALTGNVSPDEL